MGNHNSVMAHKYLEDFDRSIVRAQRAIYDTASTEE
jgi:hypothetical protein